MMKQMCSKCGKIFETEGLQRSGLCFECYKIKQKGEL